MFSTPIIFILLLMQIIDIASYDARLELMVQWKCEISEFHFTVT